MHLRERARTARYEFEYAKGVVRALQHESPGVKIEAMYTMTHMKDSATTLGPAIAAQIESDNDRVVGRAVSALGQLKWSNSTVLRALRARIESVSRPSDRGSLRTGLEYLESIARKE